MMKLKEKITEYRNTHQESRTILGVVLAEFSRDPDVKDQKNPTDDECIRIIKKLIESNKLTGDIEDNPLLETFIPEQLTENNIKDIIEECDFKSIKDCMSFFKEQYAGLYNGKEVSKLFNQK